MGFFFFFFFFPLVVEHLKTSEQGTGLKTQLCNVSSQKPWPAHSLCERTVRTGAVCALISGVGKAEAELQDVEHTGIRALTEHGLKNHSNLAPAFEKKPKKPNCKEYLNFI